MSIPKYTMADEIHALYCLSNKESLGKGSSIIDSNGDLSKLVMNNSDGILGDSDKRKSKIVAEFLSFSRKKRSKEKAIGCFNLSDGRTIDVFMMSLNVDEDYLKCKHLFRCHVLYRIKNLDGTLTYSYYDTGAHKKFYNMGTPKNPETMPDNIIKNQSSIIQVELHQKVSGSQNLCVVAPKELQKYFLFQFFSKRGTENIYSDLGAIAFQSTVLLKTGKSLMDIYQILIEKHITSMTFEIMGIDRHVSMDNDTSSLILHGVSLVNGSKMSMIDMESFATEIGLSVVKPIFRSNTETSFQDAMEAYKNYDIKGNTDEGGVMTITYSDHQFKLKCKSWWYLYLRDYREAIPRGKSKVFIVPTLDGVKSRLKMFGAPEKDHIELSQKYVLWCLWIRSNQFDKTQTDLLEKGDHPLVIDHFLNHSSYQDMENYTIIYNNLLNDQKSNPSVIILPINVGIMCSGKSTTSQNVGVTISQDQCGGNRQNMISEIIKYFLNSSVKLDKKMILIDRTNLTPILRNQLIWELSREMSKAPFKTSIILVPIFICHTFPGYSQGQLPEMLIDRVISSRKLQDSHQSMTMEGHGALTFLEILRGASNICEFPDDLTESIQLDATELVDIKVKEIYQWIENRFPLQAFNFKNSSKTYTKFGNYNMTNKLNLSYGGIGTPFHNLVSTKTLEKEFGDFLEKNKGNTKEYNSHVTKIYGLDNVKKLKWNEGKKKVLTWIGTFQQDNQICGSIVLDTEEIPSSFKELKSLPNETIVYHITGWTVGSVNPFQSNAILNGPTKTTTEKPNLNSLLKLFPDQKQTWTGRITDYPNLDPNQIITLKLFDTPKIIKGYEGTYRK